MKTDLDDVRTLSAEELLQVAGGFNPQPDPPGRWHLESSLRFLNPQPLPPFAISAA